MTLTQKPNLICLNKTLLDESIKDISIPDFRLITRHSNSPTYRGIAIFAAEAITDDITLLLKSDDAERAWILLHTSTGPFLVYC